MAAFNKIQIFPQNLANGVHNLGADDLRVVLTNTVPVVTNSLLSNITQIANSGGYTTGGVAIGSVTSIETGGILKLAGTLPNPTWTASGSIGPFRYVVLYDNTPSSPLDPLIGWWDNGSAVTLAAGQTFTHQLDATNGFYLIG